MLWDHLSVGLMNINLAYSVHFIRLNHYVWVIWVFEIFMKTLHSLKWTIRIRVLSFTIDFQVLCIKKQPPNFHKTILSTSKSFEFKIKNLKQKKIIIICSILLNIKYSILFNVLISTLKYKNQTIFQHLKYVLKSKIIFSNRISNKYIILLGPHVQ